MKTTFFMLILTAVLLTLGAGCGQRIGEGVTERAIERGIENETGRDVNVDVSDGSVTIGEEGSDAQMMAGESVSFPSDFPSDIPQYPNGTVTFVTHQTALAQHGYLMETVDAHDDIVTWFKERTEGQAWALKSTLTLEASTILSFEKLKQEDTAVLTVTITTDEDEQNKQNILVSYGAR
ncbi:hypothetical protein GF380_05460 [Candidatus Uhrbacteria bacterium]|nr:hypothetical protein [Candidatus Uhrbacteria bacterium]MBD3284478.1 hypothetical protein [Candidatus Uhrbacteria bacterium]